MSFLYIQGVRTEVLQLANLEEGDYTFTLKVTDTAGQSDTAHVRVFVKAGGHCIPLLTTACEANRGLCDHFAVIDIYIYSCLFV